ncbi:prolyl oligopeptidase family serine peptidase [Thalassococcus sp. S3]|uniref:prolyl oligopeptidase family serine peptidase n=1 Tax=Thalassococcus sp. S3 TaxID=2017482 RepID=UPI00102418AC|nr:prolyl oligopeptidase family serine peptidase [Thalassococcus sp. S3]QBF33557.1 peptidase [Thalassococcus sp. S3]
MTDFLFPELETDAAAIDAFVTRQNARTASAFMTEAFEADARLAQDILQRRDSLTAVLRRGAWLYTFRQTKKNPRGLWMRRPADQPPDPEAEWEKVFDLDAFCEQSGETWQWFGAVTAPFDPDKVMFRLGYQGSDQCRHIEFDARTKKIVPDGFDLPAERSSVDWLDPDTLLWSTSTENDAQTSSGWPGEVRLLKRGTPLAEAPVVFAAEPGDVLVSGYRTETPDGMPLQSFMRVLEIGKQQVTILRRDGAVTRLPSPPDTTVQHNATHFAYVAKSKGGPAGALMLGQIGADLPVRCVMRPPEGGRIEAASVLFLKHWLLWLSYDQLTPTLYCLDLNDPGAQPHQIALPEEAETIWVSPHDAHIDGGDETLQLSLRGFLLSPRIYLFDLNAGPDRVSWRLLWQEPEVFDASGMTVQLLHATSDDGTQVPYHLVLPNDHAVQAGGLPVLLYGYGGFGMSLHPWYDKICGTLWLSRGGAYVQAHIRGGAELGPDWHETAKRENRPRAFEDFAAIASDLVKRGFSRPDKIACHGASNGGLLCGVMLTRYPDRFGAVWAKVGVHDMLRFHKFPAGRAWIDEYGDPEREPDRTWLSAYSPLHQARPVAEVTYPHALIDTSSFDDRVDPSHSRRFAAQLQALGHDSFYQEHRDGGHGGGGASHARAREAALGYMFLRTALGLED